MAIQAKITLDQVNYLYVSATQYFSSEILQRGLEYVLKGSVLQAHASVEGSIYTAKVLGSKEHEVRIDYDFFVLSSCTCGKESFCEHIAAVYLQLYGQLGHRPELFVQNVVRSDLEQKAKEEETARKKSRKMEQLPPEVMTPKRLQKQQKQQQDGRDQRASIILLDEKSPVEDWNLYFAQTFAVYEDQLKKDPNSYAPEWIKELEQTVRAWNKSLADLYKLHMLLDAVQRLDGLIETVSFNYSTYWISNKLSAWIDNLSERLIKHIPLMNRNEISDRYEDRLGRTMQLVHELAIGEHLQDEWDSPTGWLFIYRYLWWNLLNIPNLREREMNLLQRKMKRKDLAEDYKDLLMLASIHIHFIEGNEEFALSAFEGLDFKDPGFLSVYLIYYKQTNQPDKLRRWLNWMVPYIREEESDWGLEAYMECWEMLVGNDFEDRDYIQAVVRLMPESYHYYGKGLWEAGNFKRWIDMNITAGISPAQFNEGVLRKVESKEAELLLPWYHQSIEQSILAKNRESYMVAVKQLTKLRSLYKKINRSDRWDQYISMITEQYSRLRAFQEELRKGKLLS